jgi:hypothetical protein
VAARTLLAPEPDSERSVRRKYLGLLGSPDPSSFEDDVVKRIFDALNEGSSRRILPIRLSTVADRFLIRPKPEMISGNHDGQIDFDSQSGQFVIKLCRTGDSPSVNKGGGLARLRFTYAHEMAHRFFFIQHSNSWIRALDAAVAGLTVSATMKERITLNRIEEGMCNNIARRLLIPDDSLISDCKIREWFNEGQAFFRFLADEAKTFGVSIDCLLVRLQKASRTTEMVWRDSSFAIVIALSRGHVLRRGDLKPRIVTALMPQNIGDFQPQQIYPGFSFEKFGDEAVEAIASLLSSGSQKCGRTRQRVTLLGKKGAKSSKEDFFVDGWWQMLSPERAQSPRLLLWGKLKQVGKAD